MAGFASDIDAAEKASSRSLPPSRQTTLTPEHQRCQCSEITGRPATSTVDSLGQLSTSKMDVDEFMNEHCRSRQDYDKAPRGWPRLAAMPERIDNTDILRSFNPVGQRLIQYTGSRLAFLQNLLDEFDLEQNGMCGLTRNQIRLPCCPETKEYYDVLVGEMKKEYLSYGELICRHKEINQLHVVPRRRVRQVLRYILNTVRLENKLWINAPDEALSFSRPPPRLMVWFSDTKLGKWILRQLETKHGVESKSGFIRLDVMIRMHRGFTTLFALILLIPTGILFLCELTRAMAFAVVVAFTLVFSLQINLGDRHKALYAVCAWSAVLVTVMVQMAAVSPQP